MGAELVERVRAGQRPQGSGRRCGWLVLARAQVAPAGVAGRHRVLRRGLRDSQASPDGSDGAAVAACRSVLAQISDAERLATTAREQSPGYVVSAWRGGRAGGKADYLCQVRRDVSAERGVAVVKVQARDGAGGYRSTLGIEFDDEQRRQRKPRPPQR